MRDVTAIRVTWSGHVVQRSAAVSAAATQAYSEIARAHPITAISDFIANGVIAWPT